MTASAATESPARRNGNNGRTPGHGRNDTPHNHGTIRSPGVLQRQENLVDRFSSRVDFRAVEECWLWLGSRTKWRMSYGVFWDPELGREVRAHRRAYELTFGPIPDGLIVRHKCDVPLCCNPYHLEAGTHADNSRDMVERGRNKPHRRPQWLIDQSAAR